MRILDAGRRSIALELVATQLLGYFVPTIHREHGLRFAIHTDDHEPAHVHVFGDGEMKIAIAADDGFPRALWSVGMKRADRRSATDIVLERQSEFLARWREIHGEDG
jgi:hypothetical protein